MKTSKFKIHNEITGKYYQFESGHKISAQRFLEITNALDAFSLPSKINISSSKPIAFYEKSIELLYNIATGIVTLYKNTTMPYSTYVSNFKDLKLLNDDYTMDDDVKCVINHYFLVDAETSKLQFLSPNLQDCDVTLLANIEDNMNDF